MGIFSRIISEGNIEEWMKEEEWRYKKSLILRMVQETIKELRKLEEIDPKKEERKKEYKKIRDHLFTVEMTLWNL